MLTHCSLNKQNIQCLTLSTARPAQQLVARPALPIRTAQAEPRRPARAALPNPSCSTLPHSPAPPSRLAATTAAAATPATSAVGGGVAGSAGGAASARGAGGAAGSAGGAAGAGGARPDTDRHCLSWPLSRQLQRLGVDSSSHCLSRTTQPLSSFPASAEHLLPAAADAGGAGGTVGARGAGAASAAGVGGATGAAGAGGAGATGAGGAGAAGTAPRRPFFYPQPQLSLPPPELVLHQVLSLPSSTGPTPPLLCPPTDQSQPQLLPGSPLPAPAPHTKVTESLTNRRETETHASTPVRARRVACPRPPAIPGTHVMALRPSFIPQLFVLPEPSGSSLSDVPDPESNLARAASPTVTHLLATIVNDPDYESTAAFALVTELVDFAMRGRLVYVASLVTASEPVCPPSIRGEPALSSEYSSQWETSMDAEMASWKSTGTYVDEVPPPGANIVDGMWIFIVKRPSGSPPAFKARYVARGFSQRQGVDFFQTFSPTPKMTTLRVLLHVAAPRDYEVHSLNFSTAFLQGSLHEEIWLRCPPGFTGSFPAGTQWSLRRLVHDLRQAPHEWHDTLRTILAALGFAPSSADPLLFLHADTTLPPFYVLMYVDNLVFATIDTKALALVLRRFGLKYSSPQPTPLSTGHSLSAPPSDESVESSGPYSELVGCLITLGMGLVVGGRGSVVLTGHSDASWADDQATQRSAQGYTCSLGPSSVSWRSTRSSSVLGSSCEAEIYAGAMAA
ncbi:unnamed protein product [Closterium sp. NIES-54]